MDASKGSLEPVRGSKLPMKVGKNMKGDEVRVFAQKNIQITISFFSELENYELLYPDAKLVYLTPGTDEQFTIAKYRKDLGKLYSKNMFLSKDLQIYVKYIYFCDLHHVYICAIELSSIYW